MRAIFFSSVLLFASTLIVSDGFGQSYYFLSIYPQLFKSIYCSSSDLNLSASCRTSSEYFDKEVSVDYEANEFLSVTTSNYDRKLNNKLISIKYQNYDELDRIKKWGVKSDYTSKGNWFEASYLNNNEIIINSEMPNWHRSISKLKYSTQGHLEQFYQTQFYGDDSLVTEEFDILINEREMIISNGDYEEKYVFDNKGRFKSQYVNDKLLVKVNYNEEINKPSSITNYTTSAPWSNEIVVKDEKFFIYDRTGTITSTEWKSYHQEKNTYSKDKVSSIHLCTFR